jgi:transposase
MEQVKQDASGAMAPEAANRSAEVPAVGRKRRYTEAYKLRILEEADACKRGELGALLRREGLYHATIIKWRTWRDTMEDKGFTPEQKKKEMRNELAKLQRENKRLKLKIERQDAMLDLQKKAFQILDLMPPGNENGGKN